MLQIITGNLIKPKILFKFGFFCLISFIFLSLISLPVFADVVRRSPSSCSGEWANCNFAFADDLNVSTADVNGDTNKTGAWRNYGFSLPAIADINGVSVLADFFASRPSGYINVRVSGNGGASFGPPHRVGGNTTEQRFVIDVTNDWPWNPGALNDANLVSQVTCFDINGTSVTCKLDWIPVEVSFRTPPACNRANPSVIIFPSIQEGLAGDTLTYTTSVTNNDSNACGSSAFDLSYEINPDGWAAEFGVASLVIEPGETRNSDFSITSAWDAPPDEHSFSNTATNAGKPEFSGSGWATYVVVEGSGPGGGVRPSAPGSGGAPIGAGSGGARDFVGSTETAPSGEDWLSQFFETVASWFGFPTGSATRGSVNPLVSVFVIGIVVVAGYWIFARKKK